MALAAPHNGLPDRDFVSYWREFSASTTAALDHALEVRRLAAAGGESVGREWLASAAAVRSAAHRSPAGAVLSTQGFRLRLPDLLATLAVEACVHHLDLLAGWPGQPPAREALAICRLTLDGLMGGPCPLPWDDVTYLRRGTGREALAAADLELLGERAGLFPLFS